MALEIQLCLAMRVAEVGVICAKDVLPQCSVLAGLSGANNLARIIIHDVALQYGYGLPQVPLRTYIDDLAQFCAGPSERFVEHLVSQAGVDLAKGLRKFGFEVSSKSVVFASSTAFGPENRPQPSPRRCPDYPGPQSHGRWRRFRTR